MDGLEARVAKECKEAFAELQTDMTEIVGNISSPGGIPFHGFPGFCVRTFFPGVPANNHSVLGTFEYGAAHRNGMDRGLTLFNQLISNKIFLLIFIRTLEQRGDFIVREKVNVASLICIILMNRLEYLTDILKTLLSELIERTIEGRYHPKLLLRRTESVVEKMLANWFGILLHGYLKDCVGEPMYMLYLAVKHQVDRGPVDALTGDAKYSLSEDKLIRQQTDCRVLSIQVVDSEAQYSQQTYVVKVLSCDTISQAKDKILDAIYRYVPFSLRPDGAELDLEWHTGPKNRVILQDEDVTTKSDGAFRRLNTVGYYRVPDGAIVSLVPHQRSLYSINSSTSNNKPSSFTHKYDTLFASSLPLSLSTSSPNTFEVTNMSGNSRLYHLVKPHEIDHHRKGERNNNKMVSEVYLTRLLATKGALQQYVDNVFETLFSTMHRGYVMPVAIKYMFDFLDDQAMHHGIVDPQVVHTWKSNSLPLRFWVNIIKNPDFVFDVHKSNAVDSCLSVIAQTFMDSCSVSEQKLGKDSSTSKLLYAKDIPKYKKWVERYYEDIQHMPSVTDQDMNSMLCDESMLHQNQFNVSAALYELYQYAVKYNEDLIRNLEEDEFAQNYRLASRLNQVHGAMDSFI
jgi:plexin A